MTKEQIKEVSHYTATKLLSDAILRRPEAEGSSAWALGYLHATIGGWIHELPELRALVERELERETRHEDT
jgi:hypothetical protein